MQRILYTLVFISFSIPLFAIPPIRHSPSAAAAAATASSTDFDESYEDDEEHSSGGPRSRFASRDLFLLHAERLYRENTDQRETMRALLQVLAETVGEAEDSHAERIAALCLADLFACLRDDLAEDDAALANACAASQAAYEGRFIHGMTPAKLHLLLITFANSTKTIKGVELYLAGRFAEAITMLLSAAKSGDAVAYLYLYLIHQQQLDLTEAKAYLRAFEETINNSDEAVPYFLQIVARQLVNCIPLSIGMLDVQELPCAPTRTLSAHSFFG